MSLSPLGWLILIAGVAFVMYLKRSPRDPQALERRVLGGGPPTPAPVSAVSAVQDALQSVRIPSLVSQREIDPDSEGGVSDLLADLDDFAVALGDPDLTDAISVVRTKFLAHRIEQVHPSPAPAPEPKPKPKTRTARRRAASKAEK